MKQSSYYILTFFLLEVAKQFKTPVRNPTSKNVPSKLTYHYKDTHINGIDSTDLG